MVDTPCFLACCSIAAPEALSRLTIARTVTPPVIICWAMVCIFCLSFCAFWMSYLTPAALKAASSFGRSWLSHRGEEVVSGRMTPTLPEALPPLLLLLPLPLLSLEPQAASVRLKTIGAARPIIRVRRRAMIVLPFRWGYRGIRAAHLARTPGVTASTPPTRCRTVTSGGPRDEWPARTPEGHGALGRWVTDG